MCVDAREETNDVCISLVEGAREELSNTQH